MESRQENIAYILDVRSIQSDYDHLFSSCTEEEQSSITRFLRQNDRLLALGKFLLLRTFTPNDPLKKRENGKPYKESGPQFSISHSYPYCLLLLSASSCGADIESNNPGRAEFLSSYFDLGKEEGEMSLLQRWTVKESCYKALGEGYMQPKEPLLNVHEKTVEYMGHSFFTRRYENDDYLMSLSSLAPLEEVTIEFIDGKDLIAD